MTLIRQPTKAPTRKVTAAAISAAVVTLVTFALEAFGIVVPPEVVAAGASLITAGVAYAVRERG